MHQLLFFQWQANAGKPINKQIVIDPVMFSVRPTDEGDQWQTTVVCGRCKPGQCVLLSWIMALIYSIRCLKLSHTVSCKYY